VIPTAPPATTTPQEPAAESGMRTSYEVSFQLRKTADGLRIDPADLLENLKALGACIEKPAAAADEQFEQGCKVELLSLAISIG
jgi:hypothetical protein